MIAHGDDERGIEHAALVQIVERCLQKDPRERYQRADTSVTGQILKILSARPDAVLIGAAGTPAALPQKTLVERAYKGKVYQTHGVSNPDFLRVGGKDLEGTFLPAGPLLVVLGDARVAIDRSIAHRVIVRPGA